MTSTLEQRFPSRLADMTPDWLTAVLRANRTLADSDTITGWSADPIGVGAGMLSDLSRLRLHYARGRGPLASLVTKFATSNLQNRTVAQQFETYVREVRFYQKFSDLLGEVVPHCYFAEIDEATGDMVVLLEDLSDYRTGDQAAGCSVDDAELAIGAVARLHAATWGADRRDDLSMWLRVDGPVYLDGFGAGVAAGFDPAMQTFGSSMHPDVIGASERIKAAIPELHRRMAEGPQALVHGDFRLDNFMFGQRPEHYPFVMLDLQCPIITKPVHDIAYLLSQSVESAVRREEERRLIGEYHGLLAAAGVSDYSAEQCWQDYRLATLHSLEFIIVIAGTLAAEDERGKAWVGASLRRSCQAVVDLDLLELIP